ncbi:MAG: YidC/Oxa1 family membrane protein insertase [Dehalococcoidia bacterium]|nr:YidC/Oxa1 family membrane protein insertase [Dehalococcoidia bacterium]MDZ4247199.1 YidC/Oxa1 family membrane protein insertase [Dehalococcoidia bacterium]
MADLWNVLIFQPILNLSIILYSILFNNFGLAIIALTIIIRVITYPLTIKQIKASKSMATVQPRMQELQKKYARDKQKLSGETMKLYKEAGINPVGCIVPMLVQFPVWIALYQAILRALAATPEDLLALFPRLYSSPLIHSMVPLNEKFLWLNLTEPDRLMILPVLVGGSMWLQQKMVTVPTTDPRQQSTNRMMLMMMPLMFAAFTLQFASGLAVYWTISNVIGIVIQYLVTGWGGLFKKKSPAPPVGSPHSTTKAVPYEPPPSGKKRKSRRPVK